jgi:hypothetical protein
MRNVVNSYLSHKRKQAVRRADGDTGMGDFRRKRKPSCNGADRGSKFVDHLIQRKTHTVYKASTVETVYLQFRKIIELIAMGSIVANKEKF